MKTPSPAYETDTAGRLVLSIDASPEDGDVDFSRNGISCAPFNGETGSLGGFELQVWKAGEGDDPDYACILTPAAAAELAGSILHWLAREVA